MTTAIATVSLPDGERIPALGQGTWHMGEKLSRRAAETAALRTGIQLGDDPDRYRRNVRRGRDRDLSRGPRWLASGIRYFW